jgi:hypothetical protein
MNDHDNHGCMFFALWAMIVAILGILGWFGQLLFTPFKGKNDKKS